MLNFLIEQLESQSLFYCRDVQDATRTKMEEIYYANQNYASGWFIFKLDLFKLQSNSKPLKLQQLNSQLEKDFLGTVLILDTSSVHLILSVFTET